MFDNFSGILKYNGSSLFVDPHDAMGWLRFIILVIAFAQVMLAAGIAFGIWMTRLETKRALPQKPKEPYNLLFLVLSAAIGFASLALVPGPAAFVWSVILHCTLLPIGYMVQQVVVPASPPKNKRTSVPQ